MDYDNATAPFYSEASRTWTGPRNWTVNGVNTLSLEVRGYPVLTGMVVGETGGKMALTGSGSDIWNNSAQSLYVVLQDSAGKVAVVSDATAANSATWVEVKMPLNSFTGVNMTRVQKMSIGVGDRNAPQADGSGRIYIDDIRVTKP